MNNDKAYIVMKPGSVFTPSRQLQKQMQKVQWVLDKGMYNTQRCKQLFQNAQEVTCQRLWVGNYYLKKALMKIPIQQNRLVKHVSKILYKYGLVQFFSIRGKNKIQSIEILCRIQMPNLQEIHLRQNLLNSVKSLRRCNWPKIQVINIYGNKIKDIQGMSQLNAPKLTTIWTQYTTKNCPQPEDMSWIAKMMSSDIHSICATSKNRIQQPSVLNALKKKTVQQLSIYLAEQDQ